MQDSFMTEVAETGMAMHNLYLLSNDDIPKDGKKRKDRREGCFPIDDQEWNMIDLETIGKISNTGTTSICMCDDDHFMSAVNQFLRLSDEILLY